ncbi:MAG: ribonuclease [Pseudomonadota bacterium]
MLSAGSRNFVLAMLVIGAGLLGYRQLAAGPAQYVLAVSWQPAFCEGRSRLPECRSQNPKRFDASHFTLHGLWPQPRSKAYCGVSEADIRKDKKRRWHDLTWDRLDQATWRRLQQVMPGTRSGLHKHEWVKHGTCYDGVDADEYFTDSLHLMDQLNGSEVQNLFASRIGDELSGDQIRAAFDKSFGPGAGDRVRIACKNDQGRRLIVELTIGLSGTVSPASNMADLIAAAPPTQAGCPSGVVDPVGLQ